MTIPKVSVFSTVKNGERFLIDTIESILSQTFNDYEIVVVDGASTDNTVEILKRYPDIRWISEPDNSAEEGFYKALQMCRGEYIFQCCVSDGFLDKKWFETCVEILDRDSEVSLVYGVQQNMSEEGQMGHVAYRELLLNAPPQKTEFFPFWLATRYHYPEPNYCVRRNVFLKCFPLQNSNDYFDKNNPFLKCVYNFNTMGYLPLFVPIVANYYRTHESQISETKLQEGQKTIEMYHHLVQDYAAKLFREEVHHVYRNGNGELVGKVDAENLSSLKKCIIKYIIFRRIYLYGDAESFVSFIGPINPIYKLTALAIVKTRISLSNMLHVLHNSRKSLTGFFATLLSGSQ